MNTTKKQSQKFFALFSLLMLILVPQVSTAVETSNSKAMSLLNNIGNGNASNGIKGRIMTNRDIIYTGEALEIGLHFPRGVELIRNGDVDAWVVIFTPGTVPAEPQEGEEGEEVVEETANDPVVLPVSELADTRFKQLFAVSEVDTPTIPAGTYQIGLILTMPGGDPLVLNDWHNGLLGLIHVVGLTISDEAVASDADGDGEMDCDEDVEGLTCEDDENSVEEIE